MNRSDVGTLELSSLNEPDLSTDESEISSLRRENASLKLENEDLKVRLGVESNFLKEQRNSFDTYLELNEDLTTTVRKLTDENYNLKIKIQETISDGKSYEESVAERNRNYEKTINDLESKLRELTVESNEQSKIYFKKISEYEERIEKLNTEISKYLSIYTYQKTLINTKKKEIQKIKEVLRGFYDAEVERRHRKSGITQSRTRNKPFNRTEIIDLTSSTPTDSEMMRDSSEMTRDSSEIY